MVSMPRRDISLNLASARRRLAVEEVPGNAVEVAERLVEVQGQAQVRGHFPDVFRAQRRT